jgi:hypothetical protein
MFVPSLSWQNDAFFIQMAQKCPFSRTSRRDPSQIPAPANIVVIPQRRENGATNPD